MHDLCDAPLATDTRAAMAIYGGKELVAG